MTGTQWAPVASLFILAPLVAEYLLGSMPMRLIGLLPIMAAMYGSGALLIREAVRRTGRDWKAIALLGLAFGVIEEGILDQSLFNRDYLHLHLLDYGYLPGLGTALPWLIFVLAIHVVWSVAVPIGLAEALFPARRDKPWLGPVVIVVVALFYLAGSAAVAVSTYRTTKFVASPAQLAGATFVAIAAIVTALILRRPQPPEGRRAPVAAWLVFTATFLAGSALMGCRRVAIAQGWSWVACVAVLLAVGIMFVGLTVAATREREISGRTRFALVAGGIAVYGCFGIQTDYTLHGAVDLPTHIGLLLFIVLVAAVAYRREAIPR